MFTKVILLHGFTKNKRDMRVLEANLAKRHLECISVSLPLTFEKVERNAEVFEEIFEGIVRKLDYGDKVSLVGHSSGGLVIRKFLSETNRLDRIHRCVLIATPNRGAKLADYAERVSKTSVRIFKTLHSLHTRNIEALQLKEVNVEIGAIAGNKNNLLLGKLLSCENDGRVEVSSVYFQGLKDFIILPYGHGEIHYQEETADLIANFIHYGKFQ